VLASKVLLWVVSPVFRSCAKYLLLTDTYFRLFLYGIIMNYQTLDSSLWLLY